MADAVEFNGLSEFEGQALARQQCSLPLKELQTGFEAALSKRIMLHLLHLCMLQKVGVAPVRTDMLWLEVPADLLRVLPEPIEPQLCQDTLDFGSWKFKLAVRDAGAPG